MGGENARVFAIVVLAIEIPVRGHVGRPHVVEVHDVELRDVAEKD